jgi:hypothetical protein
VLDALPALMDPFAPEVGLKPEVLELPVVAWLGHRLYLGGVGEEADDEGVEGVRVSDVEDGEFHVSGWGGE